ncbi:MAG: helix-turn-helix domain-containing protein [bacterium]
MGKSQASNRTLLAGLLAALLCGGGLLHAANGQVSSPPTPGLPATFGVAEARVGDVAAYDSSLLALKDGALLTIEPSRPYFAFQQLPAGTAPDVDGNIRPDLPVETWFTYYSPGNPGAVTSHHAMHRDAGDGTIFASTDVGTYSDTYTFPDGETYAQSAALTSMGRYAEDALDLTCGVASSLQGAMVGTDNVTDLFEGPCRAGGMALPPHLGAHAIRVDRWGSEDAVAFEATSYWLSPANSGPLPPGYITVWFAASNPYPLRIVERIAPSSNSYQGIPANATGFAIVDLVGFQRGTGPAIHAQPLGPLQPGVPVSTTPTSRWGPLEKGTNLPFPFADALEAAKADAGTSEVRDYLASHPDAYVKEAFGGGYGNRSRDMQGVHDLERERSVGIGWWFVLDDGHDTLNVSISRTTTWTDYNLPNGQTVSSQPQTTTAVSRVKSGHWMSTPFSVLPSRMPTYAFVAARWHAAAAATVGDKPADALRYTVDPHCWSDAKDAWIICEAGQTARVLVSAGRAESRQWSNVSSLTDPTNFGVHDTMVSSLSLLTVESDGSNCCFWESSSSWRDAIPTPGVTLSKVVGFSQPIAAVLQQIAARTPTSTLTPEPTLGPQGPARLDRVAGVEESSNPAAANAIAAHGPSALVVAGVTTVLGISGLAALIWFAKLLGLPMFSRLRKHRALEHPVRAELLALIETNPGIHLQDLMRRSGTGSGPVRHHLAKLAEANLVTHHAAAGYTCYFPAGRFDRHRMAAAATLKAPGAQRILQAIAGPEPVTFADVHRATGLAISSVQYHVQRLAAAGLVARHDGGGPARLQLTASGRDVASSQSASSTA